MAVKGESDFLQESAEDAEELICPRMARMGADWEPRPTPASDFTGGNGGNGELGFWVLRFEFLVAEFGQKRRFDTEVTEAGRRSQSVASD